MSRGDGKKSLQDVLRARREATVAAQPCRGGEAGGGAPARGGRGRGGGRARALARRPLSGRARQAGDRRLSCALPAQPGGLRGQRPLAAAGEGAAGGRARVRGRALRAAEARARHLTHATLGEEEPLRDLITLCDGCHRRAEKLGRELGRVPRRDEIVGLDPRRPLYEPADIAALKAKYAQRELSWRKRSVGVAATPTASEGALHGQLRHGPRNSLVLTSSARRTHT